MEEKIRHLDDATAIRHLSTIAQVYVGTGSYDTEWTPEFRQALLNDSGLSQESAPVSEGDLARQTLLLLAEDPATRNALQNLLNGGAVRRDLGVGTALLSLTAAFVILQTRVEIEGDKDGKLSWKIEKQAADGSVLKALIEKILSFPSGK
jgi:hypothetical protein